MHPLDHENVFVTINIEHVPTGAIGTGCAHSPPDEEPNVIDAIDQAKALALDDLLSQIEIQGGG